MRIEEKECKRDPKLRSEETLRAEQARDQAHHRGLYAHLWLPACLLSRWSNEGAVHCGPMADYAPMEARAPIVAIGSALLVACCATLDLEATEPVSESGPSAHDSLRPLERPWRLLPCGLADWRQRRDLQSWLHA